MGQCHLNFKFAFDLSTHEQILDTVEQVIGPNILVHSSTIFSKRPGRSFVSWHQDSLYWHLSAPRLVSAWIALSDSTVENGCMRVQPGSHLRQREHTEIHHEDNMLVTGTTIMDGPDEASTVNVVLRAGEMSLHHANLLHGSDPNRSNHNRIGFAVRYLAPDVQQGREHHEVILARGHDRYQHFQQLKDPPVYSVRDGMPLHVAFSAWLNKRDLDRGGPRVTSNEIPLYTERT
ncbi:MAG: phytanoyl-CoA dioxygenase family protein [Verrucomicrobia bacterium]|nr:phytanoyl-CoA dioxygenase family protein [Verrucomicrobiota bacterium]